MRDLKPGDIVEVVKGKIPIGFLKPEYETRIMARVLNILHPDVIAVQYLHDGSGETFHPNFVRLSIHGRIAEVVRRRHERVQKR